MVSTGLNAHGFDHQATMSQIKERSDKYKSRIDKLKTQAKLVYNELAVDLDRSSSWYNNKRVTLDNLFDNYRENQGFLRKLVDPISEGPIYLDPSNLDIGINRRGNTPTRAIANSVLKSQMSEDELAMYDHFVSLNDEILRLEGMDKHLSGIQHQAGAWHVANTNANMEELYKEADKFNAMPVGVKPPALNPMFRNPDDLISEAENTLSHPESPELQQAGIFGTIGRGIGAVGKTTFKIGSGIRQVGWQGIKAGARFTYRGGRWLVQDPNNKQWRPIEATGLGGYSAANQYRDAIEMRDIVEKEIQLLKKNANNYIGSGAVTLSGISAENLNLGLLYTVDELKNELESMNINSEILDIWHKNIQQGNFGDISKSGNR